MDHLFGLALDKYFDLMFLYLPNSFTDSTRLVKYRFPFKSLIVYKIVVVSRPCVQMTGHRAESHIES